MGDLTQIRDPILLFDITPPGSHIPQVCTKKRLLIFQNLSFGKQILRQLSLTHFLKSKKKMSISLIESVVFDQREPSRSSFSKNVGNVCAIKTVCARQVIHHPLKCTLLPWIPFASHQWGRLLFRGKFFGLLIKRFTEDLKKKLISEWALVQTKPHVFSSPVSVKSKKVMERERKHLVAWLRRNPHRKRAAMDQHTPVPSSSHIKTQLACLLRSFWGLQLSKYATVLNFWPARCCRGSGCRRSKKERKLIFFFREPWLSSFPRVKNSRSQDPHLQSKY